MADRDAIEGELAAAIERAGTARDRIRDGWSNEAIIAAIAKTCAAWRDRSFAKRAEVVERLASVLRTPRELLDLGIDQLFASIDTNTLHDLVEREAEDPAALEAPKLVIDGREARLAGPPIVLHLLAGNVPGLAIPALACSMLARSACILRDSDRQPLLTRAFVETLATLAPELAETIVIASWPRSRREPLAKLARLVDRAELYGTHGTIETLRACLDGSTVVERGPRTSVGLVPVSVAVGESSAWAEGFARDVCLFEGRGCLTPHAIVVEGHRQHIDAVVDALATALAAAERRWPRQAQALELEAARRSFLDRAEVASLARPTERVVRGPSDAWCIYLATDEPPTVGPGLRCLTVLPSRDRDHTLALLAACDPPLAAVGVAGLDELVPAAALASRLHELGATLVCAAGRMQAPPLAWSQDGRRRLGDLLSWQEVRA